MGEVVQMPPPHELSDSQRIYWESRLVDAERAVEYALRMLGRLATQPPEAS